MEPGRDLDVLVAERVMGWSRSDGLCSHHEEGYFCAYCFTGDPNLFNGPKYSTDISAAWQVVEKIGLFKDYRLNGPMGDSYTSRWYVESGYEDSPDVLAEGDTAPHAICLAALHVVGVATA